MGKGKLFGGIPLHGYRKPRLVVYSSKDIEMRIHEYVFSLPPQYLGNTTVKTKSGKDLIDLSGYTGIVSFELLTEVKDCKIVVDLR
ncbi:MAG: hypothetical protein ABWW65_02740 [Thermoprotei archaeon]